nr:hypothetical protein [Serratia marcescens]
MQQKENVIQQLQEQVREMAQMLRAFTQGQGATRTVPRASSEPTPIPQRDVGTPPAVPIAVVPAPPTVQHQVPIDPNTTEELTSARIEEIIAEKMKQVSA